MSPTVRVGQTVKITGGVRSGYKAKVLKNLNAFSIKAEIIDGPHKGEVLPNVRYSHYRPA